MIVTQISRGRPPGRWNWSVILICINFRLSHTCSPGPDVVAQAVRILEVVSAASPDIELKLEERLFGGCAIDATGVPLPDSTLQACKEADAILMGTRSLLSVLSSY